MRAHNEDETFGKSPSLLTEHARQWIFSRFPTVCFSYSFFAIFTKLHFVVRCPEPLTQGRRLDLAAGGAKKQKGGAHFKNTVLDVCINQGTKREIRGPDTFGPPLATALHWLQCVLADVFWPTVQITLALKLFIIEVSVGAHVNLLNRLVNE